ncbi:PREDICTED: LOW QUALITY PROTEIN: 182 kDa tankyrase-1-binding protein [Chrysochloris asiatica]|uniref:LOW QUALITY PROTEIN: 182 kDa tankyrase-1-binding protein n=1 Tax=Chrysochloris asiatica TaxID=185453 RepID=A0A9B0X1J2_CHRAS|nr:PREDICTED: LOW QUALITY PROTEIN: 182 kDa tankyrase-1-binding protein [Chrysochloris asiatica]
MQGLLMHVMKVSTLREGTTMASPPPREMEEELVPAGSEPGDPRAKPPVKPKPRALPTKPALPAKPSLLVPVGPRPPRGPLAELPSARKMNMLAGPQPYGGSKRPLPFAPRPTAEVPDGGETTPEAGKEETGKEEGPPLTPPARCAALGGVRKAPAPFRPASERFAATTVEEILAKMEQARKEVPASPDRLWGSRLTFNHDGSSRYGPRTYGVATSPRDEDGRVLSRAWSQEGPEKSPTGNQEENSKTPEERSSASNLTLNGDLPQPASLESPASVSKPSVPSSLSSTSDKGGCGSPDLADDSSGSAPGPPRLGSLEESPSQHLEAQSPAVPGASSCPLVIPASPSLTQLEEGSHQSPDPALAVEGAPEAQKPSSPPPKKVSGCHSPKQPQASTPRPVIEGDEFPDLTQTYPSEGKVAAEGHPDLRPTHLAQRRFSEGVLRPPSQDQEKLGGSMAALPQTQGSQSALDQPFGSGTESNWSLSRSFEWTFPMRSSGLGMCRLDSPPPSPITEATEAAEAAAEAGDTAVDVEDEGVSGQGPGARAAPEGLGRPSSQLQVDDPGVSPTQKGDWVSHPQSPAISLQPLSTVGGPPISPALLQAEERYEEREPLAGQEAPLLPAVRESALPTLEPILEQRQPAPPDQPCVLFADPPLPERGLPSEEEPVTLAQAETTQPRTEAEAPCRVSPEPVGPASSSRWLDDLLASPPPSAGSARRGAGSEPKDVQTPGTCSEGLLGWAQKDLHSEFGIASDPQPSGFSPSSWSQDTSQDYSLGGVSPRGDPGLGERDWSSNYGQGVGEGSTREWASRCGIDQEEMEAASGDRREAAAAGGLAAPDRVIGKPNLLGAPQSPEATSQDWEFRKRDSQGTYSSRDAELQDQEFGKRDSLGTYSCLDASLQDWEFGKRDSLGTYAGQDADEPGQELMSSQNEGEHDREFEERDAVLGTFVGRDAEPQAPAFGQSPWMNDYSGGGSSTLLASQDRGFNSRTLSAGFSPQDAQQQDEEFEKKTPSGGGDNLDGADSAAGGPEDREPGALFSPSTPQPPDGAASQDVVGLQARQQAGAQSSGDADLEDRELGNRGWATEFSLGVAPQPELAFSSGQPDWGDNFCIEGTERNPHFGIIGKDRAGGAGQMGGGHFMPPGKTSAGPVDWTDQLGLRNLDVSSCLGAGGSSEARKSSSGQMGWSDDLGLRDMGLASCLETGGSEELRIVRVGEEDWTSDVGMRGRDLSGAGEARSPSQARESGVGQTDWSGVEAGEFLKSRERGVGQADWTPDLGLRNMTPGAGCSPGESRELGVGQMAWGNNLGLRNLEVSCDLESPEPRGCGVGQMDWAQDLGLRNVELSGALSEAREHGVGKVHQDPDLGLRNSGGLSPDLEARELGVGETSGPETPGEDDSSRSSGTHTEDLRTEVGDISGFGASSSGCSARSPPSGSQGLLEEMLAAHSSKAVAHRESVVSSLSRLSQEEGAVAVADPEEPLEPGRDSLPSWRPQPDGEASRTEEVDGGWGPSGASRGEQGLARTPRRPPQCPPPSSLSEDFSFIEDTEILDSAMYRSRASLGRKRGHRAPAIRPGGTLGLSDAADSDARLFQDSTEPRASRVPSSDEEVVEEPQSRRTRMSLGTRGLKVNLFPALSPSALKAKLRPRNRSAEEGEPVESKSTQKESAVQRSKSCKVPGLGKPLSLPPKPEKSSGSEGSSPNWLQALKLKKKKV